MRTIDGLATLTDRYDGYIVDLWGVIHDGVTAYPGAIACLAALRARGKRIVLLSNAPRRAAVAIAGLRPLGVAGSLYDGIVTSGEATHQALAQRPDPWFRALGDRVFHLGPPRDASVYAGLGLIEVAPQSASFVLNTGPDDARSPTDPAAFDDVLAACHAARLPMLCANPDLSVTRGGISIVCAGVLAARYAALGGAVRSIGKPDPMIYREVLATLACPPARILAIGDSLHTDMAGAAAVGVDGLWVRGGIHHHLTDAQAHAELSRLGLAPVAAMHHLAF